MAAQLYTYPDNYRAFKALIAAKYSGKKVDLVKNFVLGETNKTPDFVRRFPLGKVPTLTTQDGGNLFESNAIAYYIANDDLRGRTELERAEIVQWLSFADNEVLPVACAWLFPTLGLMNYNKNHVDKAKEEMKELLKALDDHLLTRTYLVGQRISLADIVTCCTLLRAYQHVFEPAYRQPYTNVNRWFTTLVNQEQFRSVLGEVKLCEKATVAQVGGDAGKAGKKEKKEQPKQEQKKKETPAKKEDKKAKKEEDDDAGDAADDVLAAEPKSKDPFEGVPAGKWVMDDFKRFYSNNDVEKSIPYFWEKFDKEAYSIWHCEYLYPDELTLVFMSCNLIAGMFQRLDKLRKNAFGSMILFGEDHKSSISGIWVWRGHELVFPLSPDWQVDYESYKWTKLNPDDEKTKKMVQEYFSWEGDFNGQKFNQGKIFK